MPFFIGNSNGKGINTSTGEVGFLGKTLFPDFKGKENSILCDWLAVNANEYKVVPINSDYTNANYHRKKEGASREILVVNY